MRVIKSPFPKKSKLRIPGLIQRSLSEDQADKLLDDELRDSLRGLFLEILPFFSESTDPDKKVVVLGIDDCKHIVAKQYQCTKENCDCTGFWWDGDEKKISTYIEVEDFTRYVIQASDEVMSNYIYGQDLFSHLRNKKI